MANGTFIDTLVESGFSSTNAREIDNLLTEVSERATSHPKFEREQVGTHFHLLPYDWRLIPQFADSQTPQPENAPTPDQVALIKKLGHVRLFWPKIGQLFKANKTTLNTKRLIEFDSVVQFWVDAGVKVHWVISLDEVDPANTGTDANCTQLATMLNTLGTAAYLTLQNLASVEPINEVYQVAGRDGWTAEFNSRAAKVQRVAYVKIKEFAPDCKVLSHSFQGGEGASLSAYALTSAETPAIGTHGTGAGTLAAAYIDAISWHPYGYTNHTKGVLAGSWLEWIDYAKEQVSTAVDAIVNNVNSPWRLRLPQDVEVWATECNATMNWQATKPTDFRYEILSSLEKREVLRRALTALFNAGFKKVFLYAVDDFMTVGYQYITDVAASPEGEFVVTAGGYLPGDTVTIGGGAVPSLQGDWVVTNIRGNKITLEGSTYAAGWTADTATIITKRYVLGGWTRELSDLIVDVTWVED